MAQNRRLRFAGTRVPEATSALRARERHPRPPKRPRTAGGTATRAGAQFQALEERSLRRREGRRRHREAQRVLARRGRQRLILTLVLAVLILFAGILPLLTTFRQYVASQSQVSDLQAQQESLRREKSNLDEQIRRWDDRTYVIAQARTRLGFVYPGETSVRVLGAEKYAETSQQRDAHSSAGQVSQKNMPWTQVLRRSLLQADSGTLARRGQRGPDSVPRTAANPTTPYTPYNRAEKNPFVLTEREREQARSGRGETAVGAPGERR